MIISEVLNLQYRQILYIQLLNKPYVYRVTLRERNLALKCCQPLELLTYFESGVTSFNTGNMGSVGQRAAKLLSVKL